MSGVRPPALARRNGDSKHLQANKDVNSHVSSRNYLNNPHKSIRNKHASSRSHRHPLYDHNQRHRSPSPTSSLEENAQRKHLHIDWDAHTMGKKRNTKTTTGGGSTKKRESTATSTTKSSKKLKPSAPKLPVQPPPVRSTRARTVQVVQPAVPLQGDDDDRSTTSNVSLHQDPEEDHVDPSAGHGNGEEQGSDFGDPSDDDSDLSGDEEEVHGNASAKNQIAALKRQKAALEEAQLAAIARATATEKQQKKETLLKIERVVKKQVWRSCKSLIMLLSLCLPPLTTRSASRIGVQRRRQTWCSRTGNGLAASSMPSAIMPNPSPVML